MCETLGIDKSGLLGMPATKPVAGIYLMADHLTFGSNGLIADPEGKSLSITSRSSGRNRVFRNRVLRDPVLLLRRRWTPAPEGQCVTQCLHTWRPRRRVQAALAIVAGPRNIIQDRSPCRAELQ